MRCSVPLSVPCYDSEGGMAAAGVELMRTRCSPVASVSSAGHGFRVGSLLRRNSCGSWRTWSMWGTARTMQVTPRPGYGPTALSSMVTAMMIVAAFMCLGAVAQMVTPTRMPTQAQARAQALALIQTLMRVRHGGMSISQWRTKWHKRS